MSSMPGSPLWSLRKGAHAWLLTHAGSAHDRLVAERKKKLLDGLDGLIGEIGPGAGIASERQKAEWQPGRQVPPTARHPESSGIGKKGAAAPLRS